MSQSSAAAAAMNRELVSPEGTQEGKNACLLAAFGLQPLPTVEPEEAQNVAQIGEVHIKGMISVISNSCFFPYIEKH